MRQSSSSVAMSGLYVLACVNDLAWSAATSSCSWFSIRPRRSRSTNTFVSRCFFPAIGIDEDPVTGSAHCSLIPLWAERLGKTSLRALQRSGRGGELFCELKGDRVLIGGHTVPYLKGEITF